MGMILIMTITNTELMMMMILISMLISVHCMSDNAKHFIYSWVEI